MRWTWRKTPLHKPYVREGHPEQRAVGLVLCHLVAKLPWGAWDAERSAKSMPARGEPGGIEPAIGLAVIRQPVDVPMADEGRIGGIDGRAAADEDDAARKAG